MAPVIPNIRPLTSSTRLEPGLHPPKLAQLVRPSTPRQPIQPRDSLNTTLYANLNQNESLDDVKPTTKVIKFEAPRAKMPRAQSLTDLGPVVRRIAKLPNRDVDLLPAALESNIGLSTERGSFVKGQKKVGKIRKIDHQLRKSFSP